MLLFRSCFLSKTTTTVTLAISSARVERKAAISSIREIVSLTSGLLSGVGDESELIESAPTSLVFRSLSLIPVALLFL